MIFGALFKKKCFFCPKTFKSRKSDRIKVKTAEGEIVVDVCKECANALEHIRLRDLK